METLALLCGHTLIMNEIYNCVLQRKFAAVGRILKREKDDLDIAFMRRVLRHYIIPQTIMTPKQQALYFNPIGYNSLEDRRTRKILIQRVNKIMNNILSVYRRRT